MSRKPRGGASVAARSGCVSTVRIAFLPLTTEKASRYREAPPIDRSETRASWTCLPGRSCEDRDGRGRGRGRRRRTSGPTVALPRRPHKPRPSLGLVEDPGADRPFDRGQLLAERKADRAVGAVDIDHRVADRPIGLEVLARHVDPGLPEDPVDAGEDARLVGVDVQDPMLAPR